MFTRLIPDRSAGEGFTYKYHAHQENDALNPRDCARPPPRPRAPAPPRPAHPGRACVHPPAIPCRPETRPRTGHTSVAEHELEAQSGVSVPCDTAAAVPAHLLISGAQRLSSFAFSGLIAYCSSLNHIPFRNACRSADSRSFLLQPMASTTSGWTGTATRARTGATDGSFNAQR
jgi:hypothetical protein